MLEEVRNPKAMRIRRSKEVSPITIPSPGQVEVQKEPGLFGRIKPADSAHLERLSETARITRETIYAQVCANYVGKKGLETTVSAIDEMQETVEQHPHGTAAREWGEALLDATAQALGQGHLAMIQVTTESFLSRIRRGQR